MAEEGRRDGGRDSRAEGQGPGSEDECAGRGAGAGTKRRGGTGASAVGGADEGAERAEEGEEEQGRVQLLLTYSRENIRET